MSQIFYYNVSGMFRETRRLGGPGRLPQPESPLTNGREQARWKPYRTLLFSVLVSIALWGLIIVAVTRILSATTGNY